MAPVAGATVVQGQSSPEDEEGKPHLRPPPEEAAAEPSPEGLPENDDDNDHRSPHRIDSLA
jgi:hypothetical protein